MGYPDASMAQGAGPTSQDFDPLEMMRSAADLANPVAAARQMPWLFNELLMMPLGRSSLTPEENDPRFADATWRENLFLPHARQQLPAVRGVDQPDGRGHGRAVGPPGPHPLPGQHPHRDGLAHQLLPDEPGRAEAGV